MAATVVMAAEVAGLLDTLHQIVLADTEDQV
jgi:hypothetical protein